MLHTESFAWSACPLELPDWLRIRINRYVVVKASKILHKGAKQQRTQTGRKFTSQFRGVHQTFPTRRWEAQFRRGGRPTSLGCFDEEEQVPRKLLNVQHIYGLQWMCVSCVLLICCSCWTSECQQPCTTSQVQVGPAQCMSVGTLACNMYDLSL